MPTITEVFLPLLVLMGIAAIWHNALGAREAARTHAQNLCRRAGLQLLDQTVSLRRLRLHRRPGHGLELLREYTFDVSIKGHDRLPGHLSLAGRELKAWALPQIDEDAPERKPAQSVSIRSLGKTTGSTDSPQSSR